MEGRPARASARGALAITLALAILSVAAPPGAATIVSGFAAQGGFDLAPGVEHQFGSLVLGGGASRKISVVSVDPDEPDIDVRLSQADGIASNRQTVSTRRWRTARKASV